MGSAFSNLRTASIGFFGEINKNIGLTTGLANAVLALANNMRILGIAATAVGVALLVTFGPALIAALSTATAAVWAFTVALAANPFGLIAVAVSTAIVAIISFRHEIASAFESISLFGMNGIEWFLKIADVVNGVFQGIVAAITTAMDIVAGYFQGPIEYINKAFKSVSDVVLNVFQRCYRLCCQRS